ncbi:hypothetical protein RF11_08457 [Thelohanellus kitauei]|uniref:Uncharacterized protein n=1 Tax=Thelohanellus kitauei TaxID=669202 RepID=A0A0C2NEV8_THEKT|nr:hypothetical protein RF11_08457 [Thelohanellus kitauei]
MEPDYQKKLEEKIVQIVRSPILNVLACISELGKLFLFRQGLVQCWMHSGTEKVYNCCFHPSSDFLALFIIIGQEYLMKVITVQDQGDVTSRLLDNRVLTSIWFEVDFMMNHEFDRNLEFSESESSTASCNAPFINRRPHILVLGYETHLVLLLQGTIPFTRINSVAYSFSPITAGRGLAFIDDKGIMSYVDFADNPSCINTGLHVLSLVSILKNLILQVKNWMDNYQREYRKKEIPMIGFLRAHSLKKSLKQEFCMIFYLGCISPELTHKLSSASNMPRFDTSADVCEKLSNINSDIIKFQYLLERCICICQLIKQDLKSYDNLCENSELNDLKKAFQEIHSWSFSIVKIIHESNLIDSWRIFSSWMIYIHEFLIRSKDLAQKFHDKPMFESLKCLGDDKKIREILLDFIINKLEACVQQGYELFPGNIPDYIFLERAFCAFEDNLVKCFHFNPQVIYTVNNDIGPSSPIIPRSNVDKNFILVMQPDQNIVSAFKVSIDDKGVFVVSVRIFLNKHVLLYPYFSEDEVVLVVKDEKNTSFIRTNDFQWLNANVDHVYNVLDMKKYQVDILHQTEVSSIEYVGNDHSLFLSDQSQIMTFTLNSW